MIFRRLHILCLLTLTTNLLYSKSPIPNPESFPGGPGREVNICPRPELLQADMVTDSSARLTWTDVGDFYEIELREAGQAFSGAPTHVVNGAPPLAVGGLIPGLNYRFQVRVVCPDNSVSDWSAPRTFSTDINNARPCPLNFDLRDTSCAGGSQFFKIHVDDAPGNSLGSDVALQGVRIMIEHPWRSDLRAWLWSPDGTRVQLIGGLNAGDKNIGDPTGTPCAQYVELTEHAGASPLSAAAEQDNFIGYYLPYQSLAPFSNGQNPNGVWLLEICDGKANDKGKLRLFGLVFAPAGCAAVAGASVTNATASSAEISWTPGNAGDSLVIEYGAAGFYPGTNGAAGAGGTAIRLQEPVAQPYLLNGLSTLAEYSVYLRRLCAPGMWGPNTEALHFFTNCPPTLLETVDTLAVCPAACADPCPLPGLWQNVPDDDYEWKVWTGHGLTYPVAGPPSAPDGSGNYLYFRNSCSPTGANGKKAILRTLCMQVNAPADAGCHFSVDLYMNTKTGQTGSLSLQASTNGGQSWQTVKTWSGSRGKLWRREYVNLNAYDGQIALFQLVASGAFGAYGDIAIDNLSFYGSQEAGTPGHTFFRDADGDGFGDAAQRVILCNPNAPPGYVPVDGDCDDSDDKTYPGAPEILCNRKDENCNGMADDSAVPAPAGAGASTCAGQAATLTTTGVSAGQFYWFDSAAGGTPLGTGPLLTLNAPAETKTYYLLDSITAPGGGCASSRTALTLTVHPAPVLALPVPPPICEGKQIDLAALPVTDSANTGGLHTWHSALPPAPGNQLPSTLVQPSASTTYYLLSATGQGCTDTLAATVTVNPKPSVQIQQGDSISVCRGKTVNLVATGSGAAPLTYSWSTGLNFPNIPVSASQAPGTTTAYTLTITDANNCKSTDLIKVHTLNNVTQTAVQNITNPTVCGGTNGSITLQPQNGTPPYALSWSGPTSGSIAGVTGPAAITGLKQGGYRITVTDASGGCSMVLPQIVLNAPGLSVTVDTIIGIHCPGEQTGSIRLQANGVSPVFHWSNGLTTPVADNLPGGVYSVTITDGNCVQTLANLEVTEPSPIQIIENGLQSAACFGDNTGSIDMAVFGATPPYAYHWSNGAASEDVQNLPAGNYTVTVTDANGCTFNSQTFTVTQPSQLVVSQNSIQHVKCFGGNTGMLSVNISGGTAPYQILWNTGATAASLSNIPAGNYSATVTDANGCSRVFTATVTQPPQLAAVNIIKIDPTCVGSDDGRIEITMSGGTIPYYFSWSNGQAGVGLVILQNQMSGDFSVTITDAQGCSLLQNNLILTAPQLLDLALNHLVPVSCFGASNGQISVSASGGEGALDVTWNGMPGSLSLTDVPAGQYVVQVKDERGCAIRDTFLVAQPQSALSATLVSRQNALCAGEPNGRIDVYASGGTPPYSFLWSNGAVTEDLPAVAAGDYTLSVADAAGCTAVLGPLAIGEPPALSVTPSIADIPCFGAPTGNITLAVSGGIPPYHYRWSTNDTTQNIYLLSAGVYAATVLDATGCAQVLPGLELIDKGDNFSVQMLELRPVSCPGAHDGKIVVQASNGMAPYQFAWSPPVGLHANVPSSADQAANLSGGVYFVTVTDASGCAAISDSFIVEEAPPILFNIASQTNVLCKGDSTGAITTALSGGLPPFTFLWNNGAVSQNLSNIPAGTYKLTVTDFKNCTLVSPPVAISQPAKILQIVLDSIRQDKCGNDQGAIFQHIEGGTMPYSVDWGSGQQTASITGLPAGQYQLTVTDKNGCIKISQPYDIQALATPLQISAAVTNALCFGDADGSIAVAGSGGTPSYAYYWSNGKTGAQLDSLAAGTYTLTMTDAASCTKVLTNEVTQPPALAVAWTADSTAAGWTATLQVTGGAGPYDIQWDAATGNQTGPVATGLATGSYSVTVTDANGCQRIFSVAAGASGTTETPVLAYLQLWPNPSSGDAELQIGLVRPAGLVVQVFDHTGRCVRSAAVPEPAMEHNMRLLSGELPAGLYFVRVGTDDGAAQTLKWVLTK